MSKDKQELKQLIDLLGIDFNIDIVPEDACRPVLYSIGQELKNVLEDL